MCTKEEFTYRSHDGRTRIHALLWHPEGEARAVLQIAHGMVEHIERYEEFARYLAGHGIAVVGNDHLGHGKSVVSQEDWGFFAKENGNRAVIRDMRMLHQWAAAKYPDVPYFLMGHSMGSFLARQYICHYGQELAGAIICGTGWHSRGEAWFGMLLCRALAAFKGWHYRSRLVDQIAFGAFNRCVKDPRTGKDWISKDEKRVDAYLADPACNFVFTLNGYYNLFLTLYKIACPDYVAYMPKKLPVLFVSGKDDPVGSFGKGVEKAVQGMKAAGVEEITCHLYEADRHEILNETDREQVFADIRGWLEIHIR